MEPKNVIQNAAEVAGIVQGEGGDGIGALREGEWRSVDLANAQVVGPAGGGADDAIDGFDARGVAAPGIGGDERNVWIPGGDVKPAGIKEAGTLVLIAIVGATLS